MTILTGQAVEHDLPSDLVPDPKCTLTQNDMITTNTGAVSHNLMSW